MAYVPPENYALGEAPLSPSAVEERFQKISMSRIPYARGEFMTGIAARHIDAVLGRYIDLKWADHDFSAVTRDRGLTLDANGKILKDEVTSNFIDAIRQAGFGLKDSTVTPDADQAREWGFKKPPSPNAFLREHGRFAMMVRPSIKQRHNHRYTIFRLPDGNIYSETAFRIKEGKKALTIAAKPDAPLDLTGVTTFGELAARLATRAKTEGGLQVAETAFEKGGTVSVSRLDHERVREYARAVYDSVLLAAQAGQPFDTVILTSKYTISRADAKFIEICQTIYKDEYREKFEAGGLKAPENILSDDMAGKIPRGFFAGKKIAICANAYDGDWLSDLENSVNYGPGFGASILVAPVSRTNPKGIYLPEITAGTATDKGEMYLQGGAKRDGVNFNPAAMIDAKLSVLARDAASTDNLDLAHFVSLARKSFFKFMIDDEGKLVQGNYDNSMRAWSAKLDELVEHDQILGLRIRGEAITGAKSRAPALIG
jgi:isocitrate dehydrogenase